MQLRTMNTLSLFNCVLLYVPNQKQARRVYEILRLKATDRSNAEEYKAYRLSVKNRMNGPYQVRVLIINTLESRDEPYTCKSSACIIMSMVNVKLIVLN